MDDIEILDLFRSRKEEALAQTEIKYGNYCLSVANRILGSISDAEECVNDTLLQAWNAIPPAEPTVLRIYLAKITRRLAINRYHAARTQKRGGGEVEAVLDELAECVGQRMTPEDEQIAKDLSDFIRGFVRGLPDTERSIFLRRYFYAEPVKTIAERLGWSPTRVSVTLARTRKKLRAALIKEGYFNE